MASTKAVRTALATIAAVYPNCGYNAYTAQVWEDIFAKFTDEQLADGLRHAIANSKFPPTPAHVLEYVPSRRHADNCPCGQCLYEAVTWREQSGCIGPLHALPEHYAEERHNGHILELEEHQEDR